MILNGTEIAGRLETALRARISLLGFTPTLLVIQVGNDMASEKFLAMKEKFGTRIGVKVLRRRFEEATTESLIEALRATEEDSSINGVVVQLPLPQEIDTNAVLKALHPAKDVDGLGETPRVMPPVAGAVAEILHAGQVELVGRFAVIVGYGRLVGKPVTQWLVDQGAKIHVVDKDTPDIETYTRQADILVSGVGVPGLIKPDLIRSGVILVDAGTSESAGKLVGDIDPLCYEKASLYTPVPGGVGPVTVAVLFQNLLQLIERQDSV